MDRFVKHPMIGIGLIRSEVGTAVRLAIKSFCPTQARIDAAKLSAVFEKLDPHFGVSDLPPRQALETIRIGVIEEFQCLSSAFSLLLGGSGGNRVMRCIKSKGR